MCLLRGEEEALLQDDPGFWEALLRRAWAAGGTGPRRAEQQAPFSGWGGWAPGLRGAPASLGGLGQADLPAARRGGPGVACPPELVLQQGQERQRLRLPLSPGCAKAVGSAQYLPCHYIIGLFF